MKKKQLLFFLKQWKVRINAFSLFVAFFVMAANAFAQVQQDKVRIIPTEESDPETQFLIVTHATESNFKHSLFQDKGQFLNDANPVEYTQDGDWVEYQIISSEGGQFAAILLLATKSIPGNINVSVYKTDTEEWSETGSTIDAYTGNWSNWGEYKFPFSVEAGIYYTLRISWHQGVNFNGLSVISTEGSTDATLSDIKIDGETINGFDPQKTDYVIALPPFEWISSLDATPNDANSTVLMPEDISPDESGRSASFSISVTSEAGFEKEYNVKLVSPVEVYDGVLLKMADEVFYSNGVSTTNEKVNSISNGDYVDYYIYSEFDDNYLVTLNMTNGYEPSNSYLNVSTLGIGDEWVLNDMHTKKIEITRDELGTKSWDVLYAVNYDFVISVKAQEPTLFRIYGITDKGTAGDISSITFNLLDPSIGIDATLNDLQVDGATVVGFDPEITSYDVALPIGKESVNIVASPNDTDAEIDGGGLISIENLKASDTIKVKSESGFSIEYIVNFFTPQEINFASADTLPIAMSSALFSNRGVNAVDTKLNRFYDSLYVEYYIYSATDKDVHLIATVSNGNPDTIMCKLNISTYAYGNEWMLDDAYTLDVPNSGEGLWTIEVASELDYNISLKAGEPVIVRLFSITDGTKGAGDVLSLRLVEGKSGTTAVKNAENNQINIWGTSGSVIVRCDDTFVGGSVQIYDLSGRLVTGGTMTSTRNVYRLDRSGLYIVKVESTNNSVTTAKCFVK